MCDHMRPLKWWHRPQQQMAQAVCDCACATGRGTGVAKVGKRVVAIVAQAVAKVGKLVLLLRMYNRPWHRPRQALAKVLRNNERC